MERSLSDTEMAKYFRNIVKYEDLKSLSPEGLLHNLPMVILYQVGKNYGHWTMIHRTPEGIEHFDSYSYMPDQEFERLEWKQPHYVAGMLGKLIKGEKINYNQYVFQGAGENIATCGRWVILRHMLNDLTLDQFARGVFGAAKELGESPDQLVTETVKLAGEN